MRASTLFSDPHHFWVWLLVIAVSAVCCASKTLNSSDNQNKLKPYKFGYEIQDEKGNAQHRHEQSDGTRQTGSYGYVDANGIFRKVYYIADENGFRVKMDSNEPGVKDAPLGDAISKQSSESSFTSQLPVNRSLTSDERKSASASLPVSDRDWINRDLQHVRSQSASFADNQPNVGVPDSRLPLQYAPPSSSVGSPSSSSASSSASASAAASSLSSSPSSPSSSSHPQSYPLHYMTPNLSSYSAPSSPSDHHHHHHHHHHHQRHHPNSINYRDSYGPKYSDDNVDAKQSAATSQARHRPQYEHSIPADPSNALPVSPVTPKSLPYSPAPASVNSNIGSQSLYIREPAVSAHLSNRPASSEAYPPYEYNYQLPNRSPAISPSYSGYDQPTEYAPPLPSPKPQDTSAHVPVTYVHQPVYRPHATRPRKHRLLADSGLISVHGLDESHSNPPADHNHSHHMSAPQAPYAPPPTERPSTHQSLPRPQIDYERYRQLIRSKLPAHNIPYRSNTYQSASHVTPPPLSAYSGNHSDRLIQSAPGPVPSSYNSAPVPPYGTNNASTVDTSDPNAPLFMSRYSNRDPVSSKHYYDRFKQAEFASFRPASGDGQPEGTSGRTADYKPIPPATHANIPVDNAYQPNLPIEGDMYNKAPPASSVYTPPTAASVSSSSLGSVAHVPYHLAGRSSSAPVYDRPQAYNSDHVTPAPSLSSYTPPPPYTYSLAPPSSVTPPTPKQPDPYPDNDLYNPQGAVQLSIKKRIAQRYQNRPFSGRVYMNWPSLAATSRSNGYIRTQPNLTSVPVSNVNEPGPMYRYEASNQQPTFDHFKSGIKQLIPLLGSESSVSNQTNSVLLSRNSRHVPAPNLARMSFDQSDVLTYQTEIPMSNSNLPSFGSAPANQSEPQTSASDTVANRIELVRTSSLIRAIPLGRVQLSDSSNTSKPF